MLKIIGFILLVIIVIVVLLISIIIMFIKWSPVFGGKVSEEQRRKYSNSPHYHNEGFENITTYLPEVIKPQFAQPVVQQEHDKMPKTPIPYQKIDPKCFGDTLEKTRVTWFGHSTLLIEADEQLIMIDPMFSAVPSPVQWIGRKRYAAELPIEVVDLPTLDYVLITHDHYDHLDYQSIQQIKGKVKKFIVPLGVSAHLIAWGVQPEQIDELDWWESTTNYPIEFRLTPCHHYSGRRLDDRRATLWGGYIIKTSKDKLYLSGDGGYGKHFEEIGKKYGPFDLAMMECGQYYRGWAHNHMLPEQSAKAAHEVGAKVVLPIHWGAFTLAFHPWSEPIQRFLQMAPEFNLEVAIPLVGQSFLLGEPSPNTHWWKKVR